MAQYDKARSDLSEAVRLRPDFSQAKALLAQAEQALAQSQVQPRPAPAPTLEVHAERPVRPIPAEPSVARAKPPAPQPASPKATAPAPAIAEEALSAEEYERRGRVFSAAGRYREAIAALSAAIRRDAALATAWNARGYAYLRLREFSRAAADFNEALRLNPQYANAQHNLEAARRFSADRGTTAPADAPAARLQRR
jgi:cytochrome c-type biogenesis protein CcmH/NrfG